nr:MAG TPA: hypothetical protein [Bacteriophage sp.]
MDFEQIKESYILHQVSIVYVNVYLIQNLNEIYYN